MLITVEQRLGPAQPVSNEPEQEQRKLYNVHLFTRQDIPTKDTLEITVHLRFISAG